MAESETKGRIRSLSLTVPQSEVAEAIRARLDEAAPWIRAREKRVEAARDRHSRPLSSATRVLPLEAPPGFADVDQERLDRALLIDGHRGEGKTSVLMKMLDTWNQHAVEQLNPRISRAPKSKKPREKTGEVPLPDHVFVVPLPTLDLPAMPRGEDVPMASLVLNCFSSLVAELAELNRRSESHGAHDGPKEGLRERWDWLHRSLASKYAHASKRTKDDVLQYARELQDDTRRVYEIDDRFRLFIDELSTAVTRYFGIEKPPVFVVAIDDLDLAAHATTELLDVLRVFQHPAVFFLMTGDYENLHRCVRNAPRMLTLFSQADEQDYRFGRSALASDVIERTFPRQNVFRLEPAKLDERLRVRWRGDETVGELLRDFHKEIPLLASLSDSGEDEARQRVAHALPARLRRLINLCQRLDGLKRKRSSAVAVEVAYEFWRAALADRGLEYPAGLIRDVFELRGDAQGNRRLSVAEIDARGGPGKDSVVIERSGKRFELSVSADPIKPLDIIDSRAGSQLRDLVPLLSIVLEMSGLGVPPGTSGLPWFVNDVLVRTTFAREQSAFQFDWPLPVMNAAQCAQLRRTWAIWVVQPQIIAAVRDEKLSVLELFLLTLGWIFEGKRAGWSDLRQLVSSVEHRADTLPLLNTAREHAWKRVDELAKSTDKLDPFGEWVLEFVPMLCTASAWDTATSDRGAAVVRALARSKRGDSLRKRFDTRWLVPVSSAWSAVSSFLLDDSWESTVEVITTDAPRFFDRVVRIPPEIGAPIESMTIAQYLAPESMQPLRKEIEAALQSPALQEKLRNRPQLIGVEDVLAELQTIAEFMGSKLDYLGVDVSRALDDWRLTSGQQAPGFPVAKSVHVVLIARKRSLFSIDAMFDRLVTDLLLDSGRAADVHNDLSEFGLQGVAPWPGVVQDPLRKPIWFAPAFPSQLDSELMMTGWNSGGLRFERSLDMLAGWLVLCEGVYSKREISREVEVVGRSRSWEQLQMIKRVLNVPGTSSRRGQAWTAFLAVTAAYSVAGPLLGQSTRDVFRDAIRDVGLFQSDPTLLDSLSERVSKFLQDQAARVNADFARKTADARESLQRLRPSTDRPESTNPVPPPKKP